MEHGRKLCSSPKTQHRVAGLHQVPVPIFVQKEGSWITDWWERENQTDVGREACTPKGTNEIVRL